MIMILRC